MPQVIHYLHLTFMKTGSGMRISCTQGWLIHHRNIDHSGQHRVNNGKRRGHYGGRGAATGCGRFVWALCFPVPFLIAQPAMAVGDPLCEAGTFSFARAFALSCTLLSKTFLHWPETTNSDTLAKAASGILVCAEKSGQVMITLDYLCYCIFELENHTRIFIVVGS